MALSSNFSFLKSVTIWFKFVNFSDILRLAISGILFNSWSSRKDSNFAQTSIADCKRLTDKLQLMHETPTEPAPPPWSKYVRTDFQYCICTRSSKLHSQEKTAAHALGHSLRIRKFAHMSAV